MGMKFWIYGWPEEGPCCLLSEDRAFMFGQIEKGSVILYTLDLPDIAFWDHEAKVQPTRRWMAARAAYDCFAAGWLVHKYKTSISALHARKGPCSCAHCQPDG